MKHAGIVFIALALLGGILCAGCISTAGPSASPNGNWVLDSDKNITLIINGSSLNGFSGVNAYFGSLNVSTADGKLSFGNLGITLMAGPADREAAEQAYHAALNNVTAYKIIDGKLALLDKDGKTLLTFSAAPVDHLAGTAWTAGNITLVFDQTGSLSGHAEVNSYFSSYTLTGEHGLSFAAIGSTKMAGPEDMMIKETAYFATLNNVTGYKITDGKLALLDKDGKTVLTFAKSASPLAGTSWTGADNTTIAFASDATYSGQAPINRYFGTFEQNDTALTFGAAGSTMMAGPTELMDKETAFFKALGSVTGFKLDGTTLTLLDASGAVLLTFLSA